VTPCNPVFSRINRKLGGEKVKIKENERKAKEEDMEKMGEHVKLRAHVDRNT
jgi:hypothetical protein